MPLTRDREAVLAAVNSSADRGHGVTNIASGLVMALDFFAGKPMTGSRIVLLVSDGAARIEEDTRARIRQTFAETRARLYWIYLRNRNGVRLDDQPANPGESTTPEYFLHRFFLSLDTPYEAYQAENPEDLRRAISDVEHLANEPIVYTEKVPRRDLSTSLFALALTCLVPLIASRAMEIERWDR
jgi:mxaC protein